MHEKRLNQLISEFMKQWGDSLNPELSREMYEQLDAIVYKAKLDTIEAAEKQIEKLRVFSL